MLLGGAFAFGQLIFFFVLFSICSEAQLLVGTTLHEMPG